MAFGLAVAALRFHLSLAKLGRPHGLGDLVPDAGDRDFVLVSLVVFVGFGLLSVSKNTETECWCEDLCFIDSQLLIIYW